MKLNHEKSYILGLFVGGGKINGDHFIIELPFKKWGMDPHKMNIIATDILQRISKLFKKQYDFYIDYEIGNKKWFLKPNAEVSLEKIKNDLIILGLPSTGVLLRTTDLTKVKDMLLGVNAESFLSGIFDTRASLAESHRRFDDGAPVVSLEIPGSTRNFKFVVQICSWLTDLGSTTDQILYNHPNQHAGSDPYYKGWKKGFKIRFLVQSFLAKHSFFLKAKAIDVLEIEKKQVKKEQIGCPFRTIRNPSVVAVHNDLASKELPKEVRNKLFFHYFHYCTVIGCKHAPKKEVEKLVAQKEKFITFYPHLAKGTLLEMEEEYKKIVTSDFPSTRIIQKHKKVEELLQEEFKTYPAIKRGIAFLFAESLKGKRHVGDMKKIIENAVAENVQIQYLEDFEPILLTNTTLNRACILSSTLSKKNQEKIKNGTITYQYSISLK